MKRYKYSVLFIVMVIGSEVIFKCLKHVYSVLHHRSGDTVKSFQTCNDGKRQMTTNKVIFFPDQGILSRQDASNTECSRQDVVPMEKDPNDQHQDLFGKSHQSGLTKRLFSSDENGVPHSNYLKRSTSLIHLINALDSAKCSLKVCVYVITLKDLMDAMIRAKNRGVHVKVMMEGQMPNEAALATMRKNNIAARISQSSQLLHHKFALVDVPDPHCQTVVPGDEMPSGSHMNCWLGRLCAYLFCRSFCSQSVKVAEGASPLLVTGSFNWTWSAVINNFESVIISNDMNLIHHYNEEFEHLWEKI